MPPLIEIKGLGAAVADAKRGISDVRAATTGLSADAAELVAAVNDVRTQIRQAHDDLKFEATTLGNSAPSTPAPSSVSPTVVQIDNAIAAAQEQAAPAVFPPLTEAAALSPTLASQMQQGSAQSSLQAGLQSARSSY